MRLDEAAEDLAAAVADLAAARQRVDAARDQAAHVQAEARTDAERARLDLADQIVDAALRGVGQYRIAEITGYGRGRVRRICRADVIELH